MWQEGRRQDAGASRENYSEQKKQQEAAKARVVGDLCSNLASTGNRKKTGGEERDKSCAAEKKGGGKRLISSISNVRIRGYGQNRGIQNRSLLGRARKNCLCRYPCEEDDLLIGMTEKGAMAPALIRTSEGKPQNRQSTTWLISSCKL